MNDLRSNFEKATEMKKNSYNEPVFFTNSFERQHFAVPNENSKTEDILVEKI